MIMRFLKYLTDLFFPAPADPEKPAEITGPTAWFTTHNVEGRKIKFNLADLEKAAIRLSADNFRFTPEGVAMDDANDVKSMNRTAAQNIPDPTLAWYATQSFIGYQVCAILAQNWLIDKACTMPARDAIRTGYETTVNTDIEIDSKVFEAIREADLRYRINEHLVEFVRMGRVFGVRVALFVVESNDPEFYLKPFNVDGVTRYKGISQIDPYWITPELDDEAASNPASMYFYEPTYWQVNGRRYHRSHLIIFRNSPVPDVLKPTYLYGGISVPQKVWERVYAAERTANEAPLLALTKRAMVIHTDMAQALANQSDFDDRMSAFVNYRNNYGTNLLGLDEKMEQLDTALTDLDAVIMTQYQIVAAAAEVPAVKLLGTSPKGFNATGAHEEASYHEGLQSIQTSDLTPLIERHHLLLIKTEIAPKFSIAPFTTSIKWNPIDRITAKEQAEINELKARTGAALIAAGAVSPEDETNRVINDPASGYNGIDHIQTENEEIENDPEGE